MKGIICLFLMMMLVDGCGQRINKGESLPKIDFSMPDKIVLQVGDSRRIALPNRGSSGLQLLFSIEDPDISSVSRIEIKSMEELEKYDIKPGDPFPAFFLVEGKKPGKTSVNFFEKSVTTKEAPVIDVKTIEIEVNE